MKQLFYCLVLLLFLSNCMGSVEDSIKKENVTMFNEKVLDSLIYKGQTIREIIKTSSTCIVYVTDNECSECIYNYIEFYNNMEHIFPDLTKIFIIEGSNITSFHYYLKQKPLISSSKSITIEDSMCVFQSAEQYIGNPHLFVIKDSLNIHILSDPLQDKQHRKAFEYILKR